MEAETTQTKTSAESFDFFKLTEWLYKNRKQVIGGAIAALVVGSAIGLFVWKQDQNEIDANQALFSLPPVFGAREGSVHPKAEALLNVAKEYPSTSVGQQAQLLAAEALFGDQKYAEAQKEFSSFLADHANSPLAAQASVGLAASMEGQGQTDAAIQKYLDIIAKYPNDGVVAPVKLTLARLYEGQNKLEQAFRYFDDLSKSMNPYDPWASEARERKELLLAAHPELKKLEAPAVSVTPGVTAPAGLNKGAAPVKPAAPAPGKAK